jgi:uncharacterized membrane protein
MMKHVFAVAAIGWAAALPLATLATAHVHAPPALSAIALAVYAAGSIICHQLPDRSFHLWSAQMPVCARCTGIYAGAALVALGFLRDTRAERAPLVSAAVRRRLGAAALPTMATLAIEWTTGLSNSNSVRALAGLPLGAAIAWAIGAALAEGAHGAGAPASDPGVPTARTVRRGVVRAGVRDGGLRDVK